ncbi:MAG: dTDP-4-dehydrorhamnose reductase [Desulfovibrio sp.]|jgi:dTDP-4-dehydrorhamnose reductase|nr:dTDP-4-dehydrorhamnose reductase [Desulfovibrio sp.]
MKSPGSSETVREAAPKALVLGGATGLLGQALTRTLTQAGWHVETLGRADGNITDIAFLTNRLAQSGPDVVFNAAAWTQVEEAEAQPEQARLLNCTLPDALARTLKSLGHGHLVHFSTDFVFSGQKNVAWTEQDTPKPISVYGSTKLAGEQAVLEILAERTCVVRTAWLFGPGRKNFVQTILDKAKHAESVQVVFDQTGSPTYSLDLAHWSVALAEKRATGLWHAVNGGQATWAELASEAITLSRCRCRVVPVSSEQWPQKAKRPAWSVLDTSKLAGFLNHAPRPWPQALRDYLYSILEADNND